MDENKKRALITGITGQDGFFLSQLLLDKDYEVYGIVRHSTKSKLGNLKYLPAETLNKINIKYGDITDSGFIMQLFKETEFDEVYHLAAQSFVGYSFTNPKLTYDININGTLNILEAIKHHAPKTKMYFAATSELYGKVKEVPQTENTPFHPRSPYGISKLAGFWSVKHYREAYDMFCCSGILFNHESEMRGDEFVTQKIIKHIANNEKNNKQEPLYLGNLDAKRDWGYAKDYVQGMWFMLQQERPDDYVLATNETYSIREFVEFSYEILDKKVDWVKGATTLDEIGYVDNMPIIKISKDFYRPCEVDLLIGDYSKAYKQLNWQPKVKIRQLIKIMLEHQLRK